MQRKNICLIFISLIVLFITFYIYKVYLQPLLLPSHPVTSTHINVPKDYDAKLLTTKLPSEPVCAYGSLLYGKFCVISTYSQNSSGGVSVTLTTQGTVEFLHHVVVLCRRWSGPISVAVYSPPEDYIDSRRLVDTLRECDVCIRRWVSWHFFYANSAMPHYYEDEVLANCESLRSEQRPKKRRFQGTYPINVGRNLARMKATTVFVFSIDIELYPSIGIIPKFENMIRDFKESRGYYVWVLPVFEVEKNIRIPDTKSELRILFERKQLISFHLYKCDACHRIPNLTQWIDHNSSLKSEVNESLEPLKTWTTVKRNEQYNLTLWEPFFIGRKDDPEFDIHLSWEGMQDKFQVAYEMCLLDYNFNIVDNAFLVHAPGIKGSNYTIEKFREKYSLENERRMAIIKKNLLQKYGYNENC